MKLSKLRKKITRQARRGRRDGSMSTQEVAACMAVVNDPQALVKINEFIEKEARLTGADWRGWIRNLWDVVKANWPAILSFIVKLLPLLILDPRTGEHNENR